MRARAGGEEPRLIMSGNGNDGSRRVMPKSSDVRPGCRKLCEDDGRPVLTVSRTSRIGPGHVIPYTGINGSMRMKCRNETGGPVETESGAGGGLPSQLRPKADMDGPKQQEVCGGSSGPAWTESSAKRDEPEREIP